MQKWRIYVNECFISQFRVYALWNKWKGNSLKIGELIRFSGEVAL